ncbi:MAG: hypothetical protein DWI57_12110 [Chloroflexi bacterium]|nr:MAG: hypothetical protein DWI57_12110 [Chloroflexota bacterium]
MTVETRKVTISLPTHLLEFADSLAAQVKTNRSQVISQALAAAQAQEEERLAIEGYRFYASESVDFAQAAVTANAEAFAAASAEVSDGEAW